jgi:hypothetical protein
MLTPMKLLFDVAEFAWPAVGFPFDAVSWTIESSSARTHQPMSHTVPDKPGSKPDRET